VTGLAVNVTERRAIEGAEAAELDIAPGAHAEIVVSDDGAGMAPEVSARAFEPFFTTKGVGRGTGLGLAGAYAFAQRAGGWIGIESSPGQGTDVRVLLPLASDAAPDRDQPVVVIAEDEPLLRNFARSVLAADGWTVVEAADGAEAIAALERLDAKPDLLLTDDVAAPSWCAWRRSAGRA
jgi:hypothetical protein